MVHVEYPIQMEIAGNTALWTRPDTGDSPVSYPAPTYAAVKGIFESILWGPAVKIVPKRVEICAPIRYHSYATNYSGPLRDPKIVKSGGQYQFYATVLTDVCYRLYADAWPYRNKATLPESAQKWDRKTTAPGHAYQELFSRRLKRGQSWGSVCLGWKEFTPSYFGPFREGTRVCEEIDGVVISSMLRESFSKGYQSGFSPIFDTDLTIRKGVLLFPEREVIVQ